MNIGIAIGLGFNQTGRKILAKDSFNRADNATNLGNAETGQAWLTLAGGIGILSNQAYAASAVNHVSAIEIGRSNHITTVTLVAVGAQSWLNFRTSDLNNRWRYGFQGGNLLLQKVVAGGITGMYSATKTYKTNDRLTVVCVGNRITLYLNGILETTINDSFNATATQVGLQTDNTATRFDNFLVEVA